MIKKIACVITTLVCSTAAVHGQDWQGEYGIPSHDITDEIPEIMADGQEFDRLQFEKHPNVAQYKEADWNNVVGIARGVSLREALKIAQKDPNITFFFYVKGIRMILEKADGTHRAFSHCDAVFFSGEPSFGSAPGLSDAYVKTDRE